MGEVKNVEHQEERNELHRSDEQSPHSAVSLTILISDHAVRRHNLPQQISNVTHFCFSLVALLMNELRIYQEDLGTATYSQPL